MRHPNDTRTIKVFVLAPLIALIFVQPALAAGGLEMQVTPATAAAPASIRVRAMVEHDAGNRALELTIDSGAYYQGSMIELDGETAPKVNEVVFRDLPPGMYEIVVRLFDPDGRVRALARGTAVIVGSEGSRDGVSSGRTHH
jgi:hypothetical protein